MVNNTLISVIVATYNSEKYIIDALESLKHQNYNNIEIIVSDDCSSDGTVSLVNKWIENNAFLFRKVIVNVNRTNIGIAPNFNKGIQLSSGEWIKILDGDDALEDGYLGFVIGCINKCTEKVFFSKVKIYDELFIEEKRLPDYPFNTFFNSEKSLPHIQYQILLRYNPVYCGGFIFHREILSTSGNYDERYPFCEDRPFYINIVKAGYRIAFLDMYGAKYRKSLTSVQKASQESFLSKFEWSKYRYILDVVIDDYLPYEKRIELIRLHILLYIGMHYNGKNNHGLIYFKKAINMITNILLFPVRYKYYNMAYKIIKSHE